MDTNQPLDLSLPNRQCLNQLENSDEFIETTNQLGEEIDKSTFTRSHSSDELHEEKRENSNDSEEGGTAPKSLNLKETTLKLDPSNTKPIRKTVSGITVTLHDTCLWEVFRSHGTEMIINRSGRRMFPHLDLSIEGLDPKQLYNILLEVCPADDKRYKFIGNRWIAVGAADPIEPNSPVIHHDSPNVGEFWMRKVSFAKIKLTNYKDSSEGSIVLHSMHRYMAKVIIELAGADGKGLDNKVVIPFEETAFYAVTAYQNETIIQLKIHNNPFAKAFRDPRMSCRTKSTVKNNNTHATKRRQGRPTDVMHQSITTPKRPKKAFSPVSTIKPPNHSSLSPIPTNDEYSLLSGIPTSMPSYMGLNPPLDRMNPMCYPYYNGITRYPMPQFLPPVFYPPSWLPRDVNQPFNASIFQLSNISKESTRNSQSPPNSPDIQIH